MKCAWQDFLDVLPPDYRLDVDSQGKGGLWELRMRCGQPAELVGTWGSQWLQHTVQKQDIRYVVNAASRYSPWAAHTISQGYLTTAGGHRIGLCGKGVLQDCGLVTIKEPTSLCLRVARDHPGIAKGLPEHGSILIIGKPGAGKTTLLRDLIRQRSDTGIAETAHRIKNRIPHRIEKSETFEQKARQHQQSSECFGNECIMGDHPEQ